MADGSQRSIELDHLGLFIFFPNQPPLETNFKSVERQKSVRVHSRRTPLKRNVLIDGTD